MQKIYTILEQFFKKHVELIFLGFDFVLLKDIVQKLLVPGLREEEFGIKSASLTAIDHLNEFVLTNLKKPSKKRPELAMRTQAFYNDNQNLFNEFLRTLAYTLLFEDHKNVWVFQKCIHSSIVMCEGGASSGIMNSYNIILDIVNTHETNKFRKLKISEEIDKFMGPNGSGLNGFPRSGLDSKSRDEFQPLFN